jgi:predicted transposase YbfD/YdcC
VEDNLVLAERAVDEKSNEITAVPELLKMLDLKGAVVTVDALNTQKVIAGQIIQAKGHYVMAVKDNHPTLNDCIRRNLNEMILEKFKDVQHTAADSTEAGHGRIDRRRVWATGELDWLTQKQEWAGLQSVVAVEATRKTLKGQEKERRYYISSLPPDAMELGRLIRNHWSIENGQHWCLDMGFREDESRVRADHGDENLAAMRRIAMNLLKQDKSVKLGIKNKRLKASRNLDYLLAVVTGTSNPK